MGMLYREGRIQNALVISPSSVVSVWPKELEEAADFEYTAVPIIGDKNRRIKMLTQLVDSEDSKLKVAIINYESVFRDGIFEALKEYNADMIICDESQRIKTPNIPTSTSVHELGDLAKYKLILSGTPVQNNSLDLWSQYRFLDKSVFGDNFYSFRSHYCLTHPMYPSKIIKELNTDELVAKEYSIAFRVTKEEALDLPEQIFETRMIMMPPRERRIYIDLLKDSIAEIEDGGTITADILLTKLLRLQQMTGGFVIEDGEEIPKQISKAKLDAYKDIIKDYVVECGKKLVVFARFTPEVNALVKATENILPKKSKVVCIQGNVKIGDRGAIIKDFQENPNTLVIIGQITALGTGVTLTAADTCVYYSKSYNYAEYEQSLSRIHRIGQRNTCTYIDLVCAGTVDEEITKALKKKEDIATRIVDNWREVFR